MVYCANFPNLKGPRAPSQNCKKNPCSCEIMDQCFRRKCRLKKSLRTTHTTQRLITIALLEPIDLYMIKLKINLLSKERNHLDLLGIHLLHYESQLTVRKLPGHHIVPKKINSRHSDALKKVFSPNYSKME